MDNFDGQGYDAMYNAGIVPGYMGEQYGMNMQGMDNCGGMYGNGETFDMLSESPLLSNQ